jgi:HEAT repeat protein
MALCADRAILQGDVEREVDRLRGRIRAYLRGEFDADLLNVLLRLGKAGPEAKHATQELVELLQVAPLEIKGGAARALAKIGPESRAALPVLVAQLRRALPEASTNEEATAVVHALLDCLQSLGLEAAPAASSLLEMTHLSADLGVTLAIDRTLAAMGVAAAPTLVGSLDAPSALTRIRAARALVLGDSQIPVDLLPTVIQHLSDETAYKMFPIESRTVWKDVQQLLRRHTAAVASLRTALAGSHGAPQLRTAATLLALTYDADAVDVIRRAIYDDGLRHEALWHITELRGRAAALLSDVASLVGRLEFRDAATTALATISPDHVLVAEGIDRNRAILLTGDLQERLASVMALGTLGRNAVDALVDALEDQELSIRVLAAKHLGLVGCEARTAAPVLLDELSRYRQLPRHAGVTIAATYIAALRRIGIDGTASMHVPVLVAFMEDDVITASEELPALFGQIGGAAVVPLHQVLVDKGRSDAVAVVAIRALGECRTAAKMAIPDLVRVVEDTVASSERRRAAVKALEQIDRTDLAIARVLVGQLGGDCDDVLVDVIPYYGSVSVPWLVDALADGRLQTRLAATRTLGAGGVNAIAAAPVLVDGVRSWPTIERAAAIQAISRIAPESRATRAVVLGQCVDASPQVRVVVAESIGRMSRWDDEIRDVVRMLVKDEYLDVRVAAVRAIISRGGMDDELSDIVTSAADDTYMKVRVLATQARDVVGHPSRVPSGTTP